MKQQKPIPILDILAKPLYAFLFLVVAAFFFALNLYMPNIGFLSKSIGRYPAKAYLTLLTSLFQGGLATLPIHSIILLTIISILTGFVVMLIAYKIKTAKAQSLAGTKTATVGAVFGLSAPACAACGLGLLSILGLGGILVYLPFQGTEVAVLSIGLLGFASYHLNKNISNCPTCQIDLEKAEKKKK